MKNMTEFTEAQLEVMSKEKSPRGRKARMELERRKKMFNGEIAPKQVQENVAPAEDVVQESGNVTTASEKTKKALDEASLIGDTLSTVSDSEFVDKVEKAKTSETISADTVEETFAQKRTTKRTRRKPAAKPAAKKYEEE